MVVEFVDGMVLAVGALIDANLQISKYNFGSLEKTTSSSSNALAFQPYQTKKLVQLLKLRSFSFSLLLKQTRQKTKNNEKEIKKE